MKKTLIVPVLFSVSLFLVSCPGVSISTSPFVIEGLPDVFPENYYPDHQGEALYDIYILPMTADPSEETLIIEQVNSSKGWEGELPVKEFTDVFLVQLSLSGYDDMQYFNTLSVEGTPPYRISYWIDKRKFEDEGLTEYGISTQFTKEWRVGSTYSPDLTNTPYHLIEIPDIHDTQFELRFDTLEPGIRLRRSSALEKLLESNEAVDPSNIYKYALTGHTDSYFLLLEKIDNSVPVIEAELFDITNSLFRDSLIGIGSDKAVYFSNNYDYNSEIRKCGRNGNFSILFESYDRKLYPEINSSGDTVYFSQDDGIYEFDLDSSHYAKKISLTDHARFEVLDGYIFVKDNNTHRLYRLSDFTEIASNTCSYPDTGGYLFSPGNNRLYFAGELERYYCGIDLTPGSESIGDVVSHYLGGGEDFRNYYPLKYIASADKISTSEGRLFDGDLSPAPENEGLGFIYRDLYQRDNKLITLEFFGGRLYTLNVRNANPPYGLLHTADEIPADSGITLSIANSEVIVSRNEEYLDVGTERYIKKISWYSLDEVLSGPAEPLFTSY